MRRLLIAVIVLGLMALAASPNTTTTGMVLIREFREVNSYPGPDWCYHEDSSHIRTWQGTLAPGESFTVPLRFCTTDEAPTGPGPSGFLYNAVYSRGQTIDLHVVFPDGTVRQAHPVDGYYELTGCVMPEVKPSYRPEGTIVNTIAPGTYQVVLTNTGTRAISSKNPLQEGIWVTGGYLNFQQANCPPEDQNIDVTVG